MKHTKGKWIADIRTGCCAVYPEDRKDDTNGLSSDDSRNIFFSNKESNYNGNHWEQSEEQKVNALLISKAPDMLELLVDLVNDFETDYVLNGEIVDNPNSLLKHVYFKSKEIIKQTIYGTYKNTN